MSLHQILLQPTDALFFRDGRPMGGSLAGHTAAWPLPDVTNHALHAALHRAGLDGVHSHDHHRRNGERMSDVSRKFGSLLTAGPFPVRVLAEVAASGSVAKATGTVTLQWFFPRPKDAQIAASTKVTLRPAKGDWRNQSSLPALLRYAVVNTDPPSKESGGEAWISADAFETYLRGDKDFKPEKAGEHFLRDVDIADTEAQIGIAIDPATGTTGLDEAAGRIYLAHYLRLREEFRLGLFAEASDKSFNHPEHGNDLLKALLNDYPQSIIVGGQQRLCTAHRADVRQPLPLPRGLSRTDDFIQLSKGRFAVKWVLLSPAIWPEIPEGVSKRNTPRRFHPGGWLPNWVCPETGRVLLEIVSEEERRRRRRLNYMGQGYKSAPNIAAKLVAAIVSKPIPVTGWALPNGTDRVEGGAKSTHLAVPAGAVYYFEADSPEDAEKLASALNWHPSSSLRLGSDGAIASESQPRAAETPASTFCNRRSSLMGEKGFGLGVCGTWNFLEGDGQ